MKKEYTNPEIEIIEFNEEDVITASTYDPDGILGSGNVDDWF